MERDERCLALGLNSLIWIIEKNQKVNELKPEIDRKINFVKRRKSWRKIRFSQVITQNNDSESIINHFSSNLMARENSLKAFCLWLEWKWKLISFPEFKLLGRSSINWFQLRIPFCGNPLMQVSIVFVHTSDRTCFYEILNWYKSKIDSKLTPSFPLRLVLNWQFIF